MTRRGFEHNKVQQVGKKRDLYVCQVCGSREKAEGHHIIDYQFGGSANIDNIVTLCGKCHKQVHRGKIDLIKF